MALLWCREPKGDAHALAWPARFGSRRSTPDAAGMRWPDSPRAEARPLCRGLRLLGRAEETARDFRQVVEMIQ
ncbi:hypothetical protein CLV78_10157 [Aliiruegeria haliotis]|uniref:Uncharacterized protein n=1 Tax=Aliiruegeria haliotis TaxID=1280846 RepID=A0A2T0RXP9_9RHOB|nr:hypothetical protein CLV78_10157 [Aliiruegeria haliotis]